jgi:hypothetical protein
MKNTFTFLAAGLLALSLAGCAGTKTKTVSQRGWIGGEYVLAKSGTHLLTLANSPDVRGTLPKSLRSTQKAAIQITSMATNAPAQAAGLRKGDFVLEVNHRPVTSLQAFRRAIDRSEPGVLLPIRAYRDGQFTDYQVAVGREKYKNGGYLSITLPTVVHRWDLWPNPGFSLVCVGYEPDPGLRHDLGKANEVYDENWSAYLVFMEVSCGKRVLAQEPVAASKTE